MAKGFRLDTDKAQQVGTRLASIARTIEGLPPGPQPRGPLGTGVLERAWSDFERGIATAKQNLARSVKGSGDAFAALVSGVNNADQQKAQEAGSI